MECDLTVGGGGGGGLRARGQTAAGEKLGKSRGLGSFESNLSPRFPLRVGRHSRWYGREGTTVPLRNKRRPFSSNAVWLCRMLPHQCRTTNSGRRTVMTSFSQR